MVKVDEEIFEYTNKLADQSIAEHDGMVQSGMEKGVNETYGRLDELLSKELHVNK